MKPNTSGTNYIKMRKEKDGETGTLKESLGNGIPAFAFNFNLQTFSWRVTKNTSTLDQA